MKLTDKEKDLLVTYIDGNPSLDEIEDAQNLLRDNKEARDFENILRSTKNVLIDEHQTKQFQSSIDNLLSKVETAKLSSSSKNSFNLFGLNLRSSPGFSYLQTGGGALAGVAFSFAFALFLTPSFFSETSEVGLSELGFSDLNIKNQYMLTRSSSTAEIDALLLESMKKIVDKKSTSGSFAIGQTLYKIVLNKRSVATDNVECYQGKYFFEDSSKSFIFCNNGGQLSISYP